MFTTKLLKIYITRLIGILASILSYTIVIPKLSSNIGAYGIYTVVVSLLMLIQYADLGFLGAGQKYAAESYSRDDRDEEIKILSFGSRENTIKLISHHFLGKQQVIKINFLEFLYDHLLKFFQT